jgi:indolepyruvate ferredoxin oxidoreductase beta subunit
VEQQIATACAGAQGIEALSIAREAGNGKAVNMVMVGTVMKHLPLEEAVITEVVKQVSQGKGVDVNLNALAGGAAAA